MNDYHFYIFDNDLIQVAALEKQTYLGYLASISSMVRASERRKQEMKKK